MANPQLLRVSERVAARFLAKLSPTRGRDGITCGAVLRPLCMARLAFSLLTLGTVSTNLALAQVTPNTTSAPTLHASSPAAAEAAPSAIKATPATVAPDYAPYMEALKRHIKDAWHPPKANQTNEVVLRFNVQRNGQIDGVSIYKSSGKVEVDLAAVNCLLSQVPLPPLPQTGADKVSVQFSFDYNVTPADKRSITPASSKPTAKNKVATTPPKPKATGKQTTELDPWLKSMDEMGKVIDSMALEPEALKEVTELTDELKSVDTETDNCINSLTQKYSDRATYPVLARVHVDRKSGNSVLGFSPGTKRTVPASFLDECTKAIIATKFPRIMKKEVFAVVFPAHDSTASVQLVNDSDAQECLVDQMILEREYRAKLTSAILADWSPAGNSPPCELLLQIKPSGESTIIIDDNQSGCTVAFKQSAEKAIPHACPPLPEGMRSATYRVIFDNAVCKQVILQDTLAPDNAPDSTGEKSTGAKSSR